MKKQTVIRFIQLCVLLSGTNLAYAQSGGGIVFFQGTFKQAVERAKAEKRPIFFDAYASWCGPCKAMDRDVYSSKEVGDFMNAHFVNIKMDMEKGEGPELAKRYTSIDGYPSLLFLNPDGGVSKTILGSRGAEIFLAEAKLVVKERP